MRRLLLLLLALTASVGASGQLHFPDENVAVEDDYASEDYDYNATTVAEEDIDPGELQGRFFGKKHFRKLGSAAVGFINSLTGANKPTVPPPVARPSDYAYEDDVAPTQPSHGFPVNAAGRIECSRVQRWQRRQCRMARRQAMREQRYRPTRPPAYDMFPGGVGSGGGVPTASTMQHAQRTCCHLQQKGDLLNFNNCCRRFSFCPICSVDSSKLAADECCPLQYGGDQLGFRRCCSKYGQCPVCDGPPKPATPAGCMYKGKLYLANTEMDKLAYKCIFVRCVDNGNGPETVLEYLDQVGCCAQGKDLFPPGISQQVDQCTNRVCTDGQWVNASSELAAVLASPCPGGWLDLGRSCVYIWPELMTRQQAAAACSRLLADLALPQNQAQLTQLINAFKNMPERDSSQVLGGWVGARNTGNQWQTRDGDSLTFQPWEEGSPDDLRRTACAGLTVTDRSEGWRDYLCSSRQHMLYPMCEVAKKGCGQHNVGCELIGGDQTFPPDSVISSTQCDSIECNADSYAVRKVKPQCCYHHKWNGQAFGQARGWYAALYPPGGFQPYDGLLCECTNGAADCTQFLNYDYGDGGDDNYVADGDDYYAP